MRDAQKTFEKERYGHGGEGGDKKQENIWESHLASEMIAGQVPKQELTEKEKYERGDGSRKGHIHRRQYLRQCLPCFIVECEALEHDLLSVQPTVDDTVYSTLSSELAIEVFALIAV